MASSYYAQRGARDPAWHAQQVRQAAEREQRRRVADPDLFRARRREIARRHRAREAAHGLTFHELWLRVGGHRSTLVTVLNGELERGTLDYSSATRRYSLNGGMPAEVRDALLELKQSETAI